jgi:ribosomal-protein-alanine N-acetyltransferase
MAKRPIPHPILATARLRLRQFCVEDTDAMHECFGNPEAMRFWNQPVHTKRIETERAVRNFIDCTPSYYRFWAVADAKTDQCLGLVNYHDGHIRSKRVSIGYIVHPAELGLHRAQAFIHPDNIASIALIEKLGSCREGLLRDNLRVGDIWRSDLLYALLVTDRRSKA